MQKTWLFCQNVWTRNAGWPIKGCKDSYYLKTH